MSAIGLSLGRHRKLSNPDLDLTDSVGASCPRAVSMMAWSYGPQALRLRRTAKRLRDLTARLAQAESRHARMAGSELGFFWFGTVGQVKL